MTAWMGPAQDCGHFLRRAQPMVGIVIREARQIDARKVIQVALDPDDVLRNLKVALLYSLTSARMHHLLTPDEGPGIPKRDRVPCNANWFTIAQWAVLTVGRNLRGGDAPHRASALPQSVRRRLTPAVLNLRSADDRRVAAALSYGQVMVFASVYHALLQTRFADLPWPDAPPPPSAVLPGGDGLAVPPPTLDALLLDEQKMDYDAGVEEQKAVITYAKQLKANVRRSWINQPLFYERVLAAIADRAGHQKELRDAFALYEDAMLPDDPEQKPEEANRRRANLIFEATLRIAAVEQVILDDAVTLVIDHVPRHITAQAEGRLATFAERSLRVPRRIAQINSSRRIAGAAAVATDLWARVMTDQVMVVAFPAETIRLGRDIPRRDWRRPFYAPDLEELSVSAQKYFDMFDRSLGDGRGAGAGDWRRFDDRMNFVANLLRSRQQDPTLLWQPFTDEDVVRLWHDQYPLRIADPFEQAVRTPWLPDDLGTSPGDDGGTR